MPLKEPINPNYPACALLVPYLGFYFSVRRVRRVLDTRGSEPREPGEERSSSIGKGGLRSGPGGLGARGGGPGPGRVPAAHRNWSGTLQGGGLHRHSGHRRQGAPFEKMPCLFPPSSLLTAFHLFRMQAESHPSLSSQVTRCPQLQQGPCTPATLLRPHPQAW